MNEFVSEISPVLNVLKKNKSEVILLSDFNLDLLKINDKQIISDYFDILSNHGFYPKITLPTRLSNKYGTIRDNFLCKLIETTLGTRSGILIKSSQIISPILPYFQILNIKIINLNILT